MSVLSKDGRQIAFFFIVCFVILGAVLLAVAIFDPTTTDDRTAMGCIGIAFTALAILTVALVEY
jgi:hypothetical protein